jgi:Flp pilus assembly pilin Flp
MWRRLRPADEGGMSPSGCMARMLCCPRREDGQTMAEYVVTLAVITPILVLTFTLLSGDIVTAINNVRALV